MATETNAVRASQRPQSAPAHDHSGVVGAVRIGGHCVATMRGVLLVPFLRSAAGSQPADPAGRGSAGVDARRQEYPAVAPPPVIQEGQPISIR